MPPRLDQLRRYAVARTLFRETSLARAIEKLGFVQADPIRAPARAQDLILRHRVKDYRAGDLERRYPKLPIEEDFFVNYGFLPRANYTRMHPRAKFRAWDKKTKTRAASLLAFLRERGPLHPRLIEQHFAHGKVKNYWGGSSNATTHLLDAMHYRGLLRVVRRDNGTRLYAVRELTRPNDDATALLDSLIDLVVHVYAPLTAASLGPLVGRLRYAAPQWRADLKAGLVRAKQRLGHAQIGEHEWYWPAHERPASTRYAVDERVRLLAPFDPIVWDRRRFELLWDFRYRFEAYTPASKRKLGYYALPLLWRDRVIGWANVTAKDEQLDCQLGFVAARPREPVFDHELERELDRLRSFLSGYT